MMYSDGIVLYRCKDTGYMSLHDSRSDIHWFYNDVSLSKFLLVESWCKGLHRYYHINFVNSSNSYNFFFQNFDSCYSCTKILLQKLCFHIFS